MANHPATGSLNVGPLVEAITASYDAEPKTRHIDATFLPSRDAIIELVRLLRELHFPGFFGKQNLTSHNVGFHVGELVTVIHDKLYEQIRNAIRHNQERDGNQECKDCDATAASVTEEFLGTIPTLRTTFATDVQAAFDGDPAAAGTDEIIFCYPGFFAITVYRFANVLFKLGVPLIPRIMTEYAHNLTGIDIHPGATIGDYFFIDHGTGVVIGETTVIGQHVKLYQGVTLGALSTRGGQTLKGKKRHPTLEDDVTVYPGTSILGGETVVGQGAVITSNAFVTQSVPPHTRVTVKSPELQYRNRPPTDFVQMSVDFQI